jgi:glutamate N-acetyltransferase/amino-acid N-acetyltransferase
MKGNSSHKAFSIPGFLFSGISSGIKKTGQKDLALIFSECPCTMAAVFTKNRIKAAPLKLAIKQISSRSGQAIIINSGNANACTGRQGIRDAEQVIKATAKELGIFAEQVYCSSTGIIGRPLPVNRIKASMPVLAKKLLPSGLKNAASAIMTTDTVTKIAAKNISVDGKTGTIAGMAKGAGMIHPNMATMLCYIMTDIAVSPSALDSALRKAVGQSFNNLSIDNDMSTNDTVMIMSNGKLGNNPINKRSPSCGRFEKALSEVTYTLAKMIAEDGEGATKLIEIIVRRARTESDARKVAMSVADSMLVKTAVYGKDPNWGRIIAAVGYAGVDVTEDKISIYINNIKIVNRGRGTGKEKQASRSLSGKEIVITVDLGLGQKSSKALSCDLTEEYIKINTHYST